MDTQNFNSEQKNENQEKTNEGAQMRTPPLPPSFNKPSFMSRFRVAFKILLIAFLTLLLLIPMAMIKELIQERSTTASEASQEVHQKWSGAQTILGPILTIPYYETVVSDDNGKVEKVLNVLTILPETIEINGEIKTEELKRGLYEIVVYNAPIELKGSFVLPNELNLNEDDLKKLLLNEAMINIGVSDLRGISEQVEMEFGDQTLIFNSGIQQSELLNSGISCKADVSPLFAQQTISFSAKIQLKGSESLLFAPFGKTTSVNLESNCETPSFTGSFLPTNRKITKDGFNSDWKIMHLNRNYPQSWTGDKWNSDVQYSVFGVEMLLPVQQYQQSMRSAKYAMLIILLTFVVSFFVEVLQKKRIHPLQYLLIGLALCLFYSLLLSISEHTGFTIAYIIASTMTVTLITCYMAGVLKIKKTALTIGGLLACLYIYVYVLIQMETYALLAGSIGLFVILAIIMYVSQRINWNQE